MSREKYAAEADKRKLKGEQRRAYINWKLAHDKAVAAKVAPARKPKPAKASPTRPTRSGVQPPASGGFGPFGWGR